MRIIRVSGCHDCPYRAWTIKSIVYHCDKLKSDVVTNTWDTLPDNCPLEEDKYYELLYAVGTKYPNESRHETALRYIKEAEAPTPLGAKESVCESAK